MPYTINTKKEEGGALNAKRTIAKNSGTTWRHQITKKCEMRSSVYADNNNQDEASMSQRCSGAAITLVARCGGQKLFGFAVSLRARYMSGLRWKHVTCLHSSKFH